MKRKLFLVLLLIAQISVFAQQQVVVLQPGPADGIDSWVFNLPCNSSWGISTGRCTTSNFGPETEGSVSAWTYSGTVGVGRSYFKFDLNSYSQQAANLVSAELTLYYPLTGSGELHSSLSGSANFQLTRVTSTWSENTITWAQQPSMATTNLTDSVNRVTIPAPTSTTQNFAINLTSMVRNWLQNPTQNFGFVTNLVTESHFRRIVLAYSDFPIDSLRPKLVLTFADPRKVYYSKSSGALNLPATWGVNADGSGASPLNFDSSNVKYVVTNNPSPTINSNWTINGNNTFVQFGDGTNALNLSLPSSNAIVADSIVVKNNAILTVQGSLNCNKMNAESNSTIQYIGTASQTIGAGSYHNLIVISSQKTLMGNVSVNGSFNMANDILCNGYTFTLGSGASQLGVLNRTSGKVIGNFRRWFGPTTNTATAGLLPVGTSSFYRPFTVEYTTAPPLGGMITVEFVSTDPGNAGLPIFDFPLFINKTGVNGYWNVTSSGFNGGTCNVTCVADGFSGVNNFSDLRLLRRNNSTAAWAFIGTHAATTGTNSSPILSRTGITFVGGQYCIGGESPNNPLPVRWLNVGLKQVQPEQIVLSWSTASEFNNDKFEIERSWDNANFEKITEVKSLGNSYTIVHYSIKDNLTSRLNDEVFYRIKQVDKNGAFSYSKVLSVAIQRGLEISIFPNPANGSISIEGLTEQAIIYNVVGQVVATITENGLVDISQLRPGAYFVKTGTQTAKFVKQ